MSERIAGYVPRGQPAALVLKDGYPWEAVRPFIQVFLFRKPVASWRGYYFLVWAADGLESPRPPVRLEGL